MQGFKAKKSIIGLKKLRDDMEHYILRVNRGESFTVVRRSQPVFTIAPIDEDNENQWETIIDFTKIDPRGVPAKKVLAALRNLRLKDGQNRKVS